MTRLLISILAFVALALVLGVGARCGMAKRQTDQRRLMCEQRTDTWQAYDRCMENDHERL